MEEVKFDKLWVDDFGWEDTILQVGDFKLVEEFAKESDELVIFCAIQDNDKLRILKGRYINQ